MTTMTTPIQQDRFFEKQTRFTSKSFMVQVVFLIVLIMVPLVPSFKFVDMVAKILIYILFVASYDLILGYTGILSLAHGMFFGIGAYSLALPIYHTSSGPHYYHFFIAIIIAGMLSFILSLLLAAFSLRVQAIFFALVSLCLAEFFLILGDQWRELTLGEDGVSFMMPGIFESRTMTYYMILVVVVFLFLVLVRFTLSPLGRVLKGIRDNEERVIAMGYKSLRYKIYPIVLGSIFASISGILFAAWLRFVDPLTVLGIDTMLFCLLMVIIGGLGTMYGSIVGVIIIYLAQTWLPNILKAIASVLPNHPLIIGLTERWMLYFGILFILIMIYFPKGVIGTIQAKQRDKKLAAMKQ